MTILEGFFIIYDKSKISELYSSYGNVLYEKVRKLTDDPEDAWDVVDEAFLTALMHIRWWNTRSEARRKEYLEKYCINIARELKRRKSLIYTLEYCDEIFIGNSDLPTGAHEDGKWTKDIILKEVLKRCMDRLSPADSRLLHMKYFEGMKISSIAKEENLTIENTLQRLLRSRRRLKEILEEEGVDTT